MKTNQIQLTTSSLSEIEIAASSLEKLSSQSRSLVSRNRYDFLVKTIAEKTSIQIRQIP